MSPQIKVCVRQRTSKATDLIPTNQCAPLWSGATLCISANQHEQRCAVNSGRGSCSGVTLCRVLCRLLLRMVLISSSRPLGSWGRALWTGLAAAGFFGWMFLKKKKKWKKRDDFHRLSRLVSGCFGCSRLKTKKATIIRFLKNKMGSFL